MDEDQIGEGQVDEGQVDEGQSVEVGELAPLYSDKEPSSCAAAG